MVKNISLLIREASVQSSREQALALILDWVVDRLQVDVCALFAKNAQTKGLYLLASSGLEEQELPPPSLATRVAKDFSPFRLERPWRHPGYGPIPKNGRPTFRAYLAVPIVRMREILGVLEVQCKEDRKFSEEDTSVLLTLSLHLAGMLDSTESVSTPRRGQQQVYKGTPAAPGVAVGRVYAPSAHVSLDTVPDRASDDPDAEIRNFHEALDSVRAELEGSGWATGTRKLKNLTVLYQAYEMILEDPHLVDDVISRIKTGQWAPAAVRDTTRVLTAHFEAMDDAYLRARAEDIRAVGRRILFHLRTRMDALREHPERTILVGKSMGLTCITGVPSERLAGLVYTGGSPLSHGVIVARALGIPAVISATGLIPEKCNGREIVLDGYRGRVILDPSPHVRAEFLRLQAEESELQSGLTALRSRPSRTPDGRQVSLEANIALVNELQTAKERGAAGIGLYRSEFTFLIRDTLPGENTQYAIYSELLEAFHPFPVTIRALDAGGDKVLPYLRLSEDNPALGQRGIRLCLEHPEIFLTQFRALLRANAEFGNLRLLLPMLTLASELQQAKALIKRAQADLLWNGEQAKLPPVGIMVEVPAAVFRIGELAADVDFVSIGTNDLTQYILAADRTNPYVGKMCDPLTPAVLDAIRMTVEGAQKQGIPVSVCGELAGDPYGALLLLGLGVDALSMAPGNIARIKQLIRGFSTEEARELWEKALQKRTARRIREILAQALEDKGLGSLIRPGK